MRRTFLRIILGCCLGLIISAQGYGKQVQLNASLNNSYLRADAKQLLYLKVGLQGFKLDNSSSRTPINVAIVLDKSGSMQGDKINQAKEAAILAINQLSTKDIVSIVLYDDVVSVLVPATRVSDKEQLIRAIRQINAGGSTALFAGVSKGAAEVRKFLDKNRANRVILLSDGLANVGPDSTGAFAELGASLVKEGISVTTIGLGLGYNEDLMVALAQQSDGNHAFVEESGDLAKIFTYEFGDVLSVVAQEVTITINCDQGIRPVRVMNRDADIAGQKVSTIFNQLYSEQEKYILLEMEVPAGSNGTSRQVARVDIAYANMQTKTTDRLSSKIAVNFTDSEELISKNENADVMVAAIMQLATLTNVEAVKLRDEGNLPGAQQLLKENAAMLKSSAAIYDSEELYFYGEANEDDALNLDDNVWNERRKSMTKDQYSNQAQQSY